MTLDTNILIVFFEEDQPIVDALSIAKTFVISQSEIQAAHGTAEPRVVESLRTP